MHSLLCVYVHLHVCICVCVYVCVCVCVRVSLCVCVCVCPNVHTCTCVYEYVGVLCVHVYLSIFHVYTYEQTLHQLRAAAFCSQNMDYNNMTKMTATIKILACVCVLCVRGLWVCGCGWVRVFWKVLCKHLYSRVPEDVC